MASKNQDNWPPGAFDALKAMAAARELSLNRMAVELTQKFGQSFTRSAVYRKLRRNGLSACPSKTTAGYDSWPPGALDALKAMAAAQELSVPQMTAELAQKFNWSFTEAAVRGKLQRNKLKFRSQVEDWPSGAFEALKTMAATRELGFEDMAAELAQTFNWPCTSGMVAGKIWRNKLKARPPKRGRAPRVYKPDTRKRARKPRVYQAKPKTIPPAFLKKPGRLFMIQRWM